MPTDLQHAIETRRMRDRHAWRRNWLMLVTIACVGAGVTVARAVHSESFAAVLGLFATIG